MGVDHVVSYTYQIRTQRASLGLTLGITHLIANYVQSLWGNQHSLALERGSLRGPLSLKDLLII